VLTNTLVDDNMEPINVLVYNNVKKGRDSMALDLTSYTQLRVKFFRGFGDKTRLAILESLKSGEKTVSEIVGYTSGACGNQSNISQHLSCLRGCGIVKSRQEGKYTYYSIRSKEIEQFLLQADVILKGITEEMWMCSQNDELIK
jgi:DNA-binding transcriptional ArsR family regulator